MKKWMMICAMVGLMAAGGTVWAANGGGKRAPEKRGCEMKSFEPGPGGGIRWLIHDEDAAKKLNKTGLDRVVTEQAKAGKMIKLKGLLVEVTHPKGWRWRSSLSRSDSGDGSCEVIFVEAAEIVD